MSGTHWLSFPVLHETAVHADYLAITLGQRQLRSSRNPLWLWFVAVLVCPGCLTHLIVLRFADAFFEHLRTLAPALGIFVFSEGVCCLPSG